jgi:hypothetical protein
MTTVWLQFDIGDNGREEQFKAASISNVCTMFGFSFISGVICSTVCQMTHGPIKKNYTTFKSGTAE